MDSFNEMSGGSMMQLSEEQRNWVTLKLNEHVMLKFNMEEKRKLASKISDRIEFSIGNMDKLHRIWEKCIDAYRTERSITPQRGVKKPQATIHTPTMYTQCEVVTSMHSMLMLDNARNFIKIVELDTCQRLYALENLLFNAVVDGGYRYELSKVFKIAFLCGVGIGKLIPDYAAGIPIISAINIFDFFIDPSASSIGDAQYVCFRYWLSIEDVAARANSGEFDEREVDLMMKEFNLKTEILKMLPTLEDYDLSASAGIGARDASDTGEKSTVSVPNRDITDTGNKFRRILCYEYWTKDKVITVMEKKYIARAVVNIFSEFPFYLFYTSPPLPGELWVKGMGETILPLQDEIDTKRSQRIDNVNKILNPPVLRVMNTIKDDQKLQYAAGNVIDCTTVDGVKPLPPIDATQQTTMEIMAIRSDIDEVTGANQTVMGMPVKKERMSVTETTNVYQRAQGRFEYSNLMLGITGLIPLLKGMLKMMSLMGGERNAPTDINNRGPIAKIPPEYLLKEYRISVQINPVQAQEDAQNAMTMYQILANDPMVNRDALLKFFVSRVFPDYPIDLFNSPMMQPPVNNPVQGIDNNLKI